MRLRRLASDFNSMMELNRRGDLIKIDWDGELPEKYIVTYMCKGLIWLPENPAPSISSRHQVGIYLHANYPRNPPVLQWLTPIFHPNILSPDKNGGVCIGHWTPAESLDQLCLRIGQMVQYQNFSVDDALDIEAAEWVKNNLKYFPIDRRPLIQKTVVYNLEIE